MKAVQARLLELKLEKPVFVGGIIPPDDAKTLLAGGVAAVFGPGSSIQEIAEKIHEIVNRASDRKT